MPLPRPGAGEGRADFLDRCAGDEVMNREYPEGKQRWAVCNSLWDRGVAGKIRKHGKRE